MTEKETEDAISFEMDNAVPETILRAIQDDSDYDGDQELARFYHALSVQQKAVVDVTMVMICGWSLDTLVRSAEKKLPVDECQQAGYNPFFILHYPGEAKK